MTEQKPLKGVALILMTFALSLACFMQILDGTITNVAIPTISGNIGASFSQGTWVITSFAVANAISIPITGWLAKRIGEVRLFIGSVLLFIVTSWLCGISQSLDMLVMGRILQGLASGPIIPLSQSLLLNNYPKEKRGMALALWSLTIIIAPICGPILGGWISDNIHWGWIFFINIPIGIVVATMVWRLLGKRETPIAHAPIDTFGLVFLVIGVGCLQFMLDRGREEDWFESNEIIILAIFAVLFLVLLSFWERDEKHPIIDFSLFKDRNFTVGVIAMSLGFAVYLGMLIIMPLLLQQVYGYSATMAGLVTAPIGFFAIILSPLLGRFGHLLDMRYVVAFGFIVFAITFYWRAITFEPNIAVSDVIWPQLIQGIGATCFFMPLTNIVLSHIPKEKMASASSLFNFLRTLAGSIGTSVSTFLWYRREAVHHSQLTEFISPFNWKTQLYYDEMTQRGVAFEQAHQIINHDITRQGFIIAANEIFWLYAILFLCLLGIIFLARKKT